MKTTLNFFIIFALLLSLISFKQDSGAWTPKQLIEPAVLAKIIKDPNASKPVIFSIGPTALIKGAVPIGTMVDPANMAKLRSWLEKLPKNANIVVYCGCCRFENCPNVRPAMKLMQDMNFPNTKLLNLTESLQTDWIDKGYPVN